jgi:hypothetical protein
MVQWMFEIQEWPVCKSRQCHVGSNASEFPWYYLRGFGPLANYADRATAASWRGQRNASPRVVFSVFLTGAATISSK